MAEVINTGNMSPSTQNERIGSTDALGTPSVARYFGAELSPLSEKWIAIEGVDAVGKSTQLAALQDTLQRSGLTTRTITEFSCSPVGLALQQIIAEQRFYSLDKDLRTPIADTVVLLGDFIYSLEAISNTNEPTTLISDRGLLSLIAYQAKRLSDANNRISIKEAGALIKALAQSALSSLRTPDLSIVLTLPAAAIQKRVQNRGETALSESQLNSLIQTQDLFSSLTTGLPVTVIDVSNLSVEQTTQTILETSIKYFGSGTR